MYMRHLILIFLFVMLTMIPVCSIAETIVVKGKDIHGEDRGQCFHASADPLLAEGVVLSGGMVHASKKCPSNTPLNGVDDTDFSRIKLLNSM